MLLINKKWKLPWFFFEPFWITRTVANGCRNCQVCYTCCVDIIRITLQFVSFKFKPNHSIKVFYDVFNENMKLHQIVRKLNKRLDVTPKTTINYNLFHTICYIAEAWDARSFCSVWLVLECVSFNHVKMYVKRQLDVWFVSYLIISFLTYLHTLLNSLFYPFHIIFPGKVKWCFYIWLHDRNEIAPCFLNVLHIIYNNLTLLFLSIM